MSKYLSLRHEFLVGTLVAVLAAGTLLLGAARDAAAHPHAWIDIRVQVLFDKTGKIYALRQHWNFDPLYTAFALETIPRTKGEPLPQDKLDALMAENLGNMKDYDYLTEVETPAGKAKIAGVKDGETTLVKDRLQMTFTVLLETPLDAVAETVVYAVFDPTYYVEILHVEDSGAVKLANAPAGCAYRLRAPKPDPEAVALAASLDRTQSAGDGLGKFFAERVSIQCGAQP